MNSFPSRPTDPVSIHLSGPSIPEGLCQTNILHCGCGHRDEGDDKYHATRHEEHTEPPLIALSESSTRLKQSGTAASAAVSPNRLMGSLSIASNDVERANWPRWLTSFSSSSIATGNYVFLASARLAPSRGARQLAMGNRTGEGVMRKLRNYKCHADCNRHEDVCCRCKFCYGKCGFCFVSSADPAKCAAACLNRLSSIIVNRAVWPGPASAVPLKVVARRELTR